MELWGLASLELPFSLRWKLFHLSLSWLLLLHIAQPKWLKIGRCAAVTDYRLGKLRLIDLFERPASVNVGSRGDDSRWQQLRLVRFPHITVLEGAWNINSIDLDYHRSNFSIVPFHLWQRWTIQDIYGTITSRGVGHEVAGLRWSVMCASKKLLHPRCHICLSCLI